jgi:hypothetical protein
MFRKHLQSRMQLVAVATLVIGASGAALADDNSMSVLSGDSYAYFNNLEYSAGHFNVARASQVQPQDPVATTPKRDPAQTELRIMLAAPPRGITLPSPFHDNTGA